MKRNPMVWMASLLIFVPLAWLLWSAPAEMTPSDIAMSAGALVTALALLSLLWRGQAQGRWLAHRCVTCDRAMRKILPGELRPPPGQSASKPPTWRCSQCGRLYG